MSSPCSPQRPDGLEALGAAVRQVAEDSLFACAEPCERSRTAGLLEARPVAEPWLTAAIAFDGPFEGVVRMALPRALAGDLAGAFCGVRPQSLDASQVDDFAGELANMVCGLWLTQTHRTERFALTPPVVDAAAARDIVAMATADPGAFGIALNDTPVLVRLTAGGPTARS
jgi:CheY-specific phosphatase CheX